MNKTNLFCGSRPDARLNLALFPGSPIGKREEESLVSVNNECASIPNKRCSVTTKLYSIDEKWRVITFGKEVEHLN